MKKQELIERIEGLKNIFGNKCEYVKIDLMIKLVSELDEPEKVKVPQCVHKYIQEAQKYNWDLQDLMKSIDDEDSEELQRWFYHECNQETLARAWLDGYEVEKEKRYVVKIKATGQCLGRYYLNNEILYPKFIYTGRNADDFTRKELEEANFGWVFSCEGIEIEEVEG